MERTHLGLRRGHGTEETALDRSQQRGSSANHRLSYAYAAGGLDWDGDPL